MQLPVKASWLVELERRVGAYIGRRVVGISSTCVASDGRVQVSGAAQNDNAAHFEFTAAGPFDIEEGQELPTPDLQRLFPYGTEFAPPVPEAPLIENAEGLWAWSEPKVPVLIQPRMKGVCGVIEKKGGEAQLWYVGKRGVDELSKYPTLKEFVLKVDGDFVAEVNVGIDQSGAPAPDQTERLLSEVVPTYADHERLVVTLCDLMYLNEDLHEKDAALRYETLQKFHQDKLSAQPEFQMLPVQKASDQFEVTNSLNWARDFVGSDGAITKLAAATYPLDGKTTQLCYTSKQDPPTISGIYKSLAAERIIYCVVLRPNFLDAQEDTMSPEDVMQAAHTYLENARVIGLRHGNDPVYGAKPVPGAVLESYIAPVDFKLGRGEVKAGDWVIALRIDDQGIWDKIESGEYQGVSVGGVGARQEI